MLDSTGIALCATSVISFILLTSWVSRNNEVRKGLPPGPKGWPLIGNLLDINVKEPWVTYAEWGKRYGGLVHSTVLGQDFLIINDKEIAHELLERRSAIYADRPYLPFSEFFGLSFVTPAMPYGNKWRLHRKMFNVAFAKQVALEYKPLQIQKARQLLHNLISSQQDYVKHVQTFSGSVIMAITYGYDVAPENDPYVTNFMRFGETILEVLTAERAALLTAFPFLAHIPSWLPGGLYKQRAGKCRALARQMLDNPVNYVKQSIAAGSAKKSLVYDLLFGCIRMTTDENPDEVIKEVAASAFAAGGETTFATLMVFMLAMTLHPEVQIKAQEEIDRVVGHNRLPDFNDKENLPYVEAILLETIRWFPVSPLLVPHFTTADDIYDGMYIPKGANVLVNVRAMTQNEARFQDPAVFKPERHLTLDGKVVEDTSMSLSVFGFGRRICPGRYVAQQSLWAAMVSILATLHIRKAKDEFGNEIDFKPEYTAGLAIHPKPFPCTIKPRSSTAEELIHAAATDTT